MTHYDAGSVVLVRFPFTDLTSAKRRPALVLSSREYTARYGDVVVMALTSQPQTNGAAPIIAWRQAGLPKPTWLKPLLATLSATLIDRQLGLLTAQDSPAVAKIIASLIDTRFRTA